MSHRGGRARRGLLTLVGLCLVASAGCGLRGGGESRCRSLLLITIDTWRGDALGAAGNPAIRTAALDRFFRRGVQFAEAYAPVPTTLASHTSLLTGAWPTHHGVPANLWRVPDDLTTVAEILSDEGFATAAFVSSAALDPAVNLGQGFDVYNFKIVARAHMDLPWRPAPMTLRRAFLWWRRKEAPRFLWVHLWEPHAPYEPPVPLAEVYDPEYTGSANGSMDFLMDFWDDASDLAPRDAAHLKALYHAEVAALDRAVGRFLAALDLEETAVVVTSDHGESMGEHGLYFKHGPHVFPGDVRVPLAVRAPGIAPAVVRRQARLIDVPRTVLRLLGIADRPLPAEGRDLLRPREGSREPPVFCVASQPQSRLAGAHTYPGSPLQRAIRMPDAAYVETPYKRESAWFDRREDPGELRGGSVPETAGADSLRSALQAWIRDAPPRPGTGRVDLKRLQEQMKSLGYLN